MQEKRPMAGKGKLVSSKGTKVRLADGRTVIYPISDPDPVAFVKALKRQQQRRAAARLERMRRGLAARELSPPPVEQTYTPLPGGWTLDVQ